jgi:hypothetical protein
MRSAAALEIYRRGRAPADRAAYIWWTNPEFAALFGATPAVTVGLAVRRETFARIRNANGSPPLVITAARGRAPRSRRGRVRASFPE